MFEKSKKMPKKGRFGAKIADLAAKLRKLFEIYDQKPRPLANLRIDAFLLTYSLAECLTDSWSNALYNRLKTLCSSV